MVEEIGYGLLAVSRQGGCGRLLTIGSCRDLISAPWLQVILVAAAALAYGVVRGALGSGFIRRIIGGAISGDSPLGNPRRRRG